MIDTTAAAELGMGCIEGIHEAENWNAEGWDEQEYESQPPVREPEDVRGRGTGAGLSSSNYGRLESKQSRPCPSAPEPPQKRTRASHRKQGIDRGNFEENGGSTEETDSQLLNYSADNYDAEEWYGPESGGELGCPGGGGGGGGGDGSWCPGYAPEAGPQQQFTDPGMIPSFYHDGMAVDYRSAGPANYFGMSAPPLGSGLGNGRGRASHVFYKTKLCSRFRAGACTFDGSCNFAHGTAELRKLPPGWDGIIEPDRNGRGRGEGRSSAPNQSFAQNETDSSDYRRFHKTRPCKNYFSEGVCPYGDKCTFLHDIDGMQPRTNKDRFSSRRYPGGGGQGGRRGIGSSGWKKKMCRKWETTGDCNYGENCHYAHGTSELQKYSGSDADSYNNGAYMTSYKDGFGGSGPNSSIEAPYNCSEGTKLSVDSKARLHGSSSIYEDCHNDHEWETPHPVGVEWQDNQSLQDDYAENGFYLARSAQYFHQQLQQNVPYHNAANKHNVSQQPQSVKDIGIRGAAKSLTADEQGYYEVDQGYEEEFDAFQA